jgi:hypothetical protein
MTRHIYRKMINALWPVDQASKDALAKLDDGQHVTIEIRRPRSIKFHRRYWALVSLVWENIDQERYPTADDLHAALKVCAGIRTQIVLPDGTIGFIPGSIAFDKMSADEFNAFYNRICDLVAKYFIPGIDKAALKAEVSDLIGLAA